jgi:hypothetical protein
MMIKNGIQSDERDGMEEGGKPGRNWQEKI